MRDDLSVRQTEALVAKRRHPPEKTASGAPAKGKTPQVRKLEEDLRIGLGTRVTIHEGARKGRGKIVVDFYSHDDFERIFDRMTGRPPVAS